MVTQFGRAYVVALLAGDEIGVELVICDVMDVELMFVEIDE